MESHSVSASGSREPPEFGQSQTWRSLGIAVAVAAAALGTDLPAMGAEFWGHTDELGTSKNPLHGSQCVSQAWSTV